MSHIRTELSSNSEIVILVYLSSQPLAGPWSSVWFISTWRGRDELMAKPIWMTPFLATCSLATVFVTAASYGIY